MDVTRVLCATDLSEAADEAIRQSAEWSRLHGARLHVFHALPSPLHTHPVLPFSAARAHASMPELEKLVLEALAKRVEEVAGQEAATDLVVDVLEGEPYAAVVRYAEEIDADLVVVGSRGATGLTRQVLGGVAEKVVRYAHVPVLVARPVPGSGRVVAATDLSDPSLPAIKAAADHARRRGASLTVVHCIHFPAAALLAAPDAIVPLAPPTEGERRRTLEESRSRLDEAIRTSGGADETVLVEGPPIAEVLRLVERLSADLLVVGTRGRTGFARVALGSVAEALVRFAACPVLAVRLHAP